MRCTGLVWRRDAFGNCSRYCGLDGRTTRKLDRRLKRVTKRLGAVRDLDVLRGLIEELRRPSIFKDGVDGIKPRVLEDKRKIARGRLHAQLSPAR